MRSLACVVIFLFCFRDSDSFDMRKKLPFSVGLMLRLLKKNHRVYITCTTGLDRSPACVVAYLHWMTDTSLHAAYNFITSLHSCKPDRFLPTRSGCLLISLGVGFVNLIIRLMETLW